MTRLVQFTLTSLAAIALLGCDGCSWPGGGGTGSGGPTGDGKPESISQCCSSGNPAGYLKTNDNWSPTSCGNPTSITYNVCTYRRFGNKIVGATMNVCAGQALPSGWGQTNTTWSPTSCGSPTTITQNVQTIRRNN